jgi:FK506-binding nuclear protein
MFFGITLLPGQRYEVHLKYNLQLGQVSLGLKYKEGERAPLEIEVEDHKFIVCTLQGGRVDHTSVSLHFIAGSKISFTNHAKRSEVHLTGAYFEDEEYGEAYEDNDDDELVDVEEFVSPLNSSESDDSSGDDDFAPSVADLDEEEEDDSFVVGDDHVDYEDDDDLERMYELERQAKLEKKNRKRRHVDDDDDDDVDRRRASSSSSAAAAAAATKAREETPSKKQRRAAAADAEPAKSAKTPTKKSGSKPDTPVPADKKSRSGGIVNGKKGLKYEVLKDPGSGSRMARRNNKVRVGYVGRVEKTGKVFDKASNFQFKLGAGEVIEGWDLGVDGMRVGEKRRLIIPAKLAYGADGVRDRGRVVIPRNATLVFDVTLHSC